MDPMRESARGAELLLAASIVRQRCEVGRGRGDVETFEVSTTTSEICSSFIPADLIVQGCVEACQRMFFDDRKKSKKKKKKAHNDDAEASPEAVDIFVDAIIGY